MEEGGHEEATTLCLYFLVCHNRQEKKVHASSSFSSTIVPLMAKDPHILTHSWEETRKQNTDPESHSTQNQKSKPGIKNKKTRGRPCWLLRKSRGTTPKINNNNQNNRRRKTERLSTVEQRERRKKWGGEERGKQNEYAGVVIP
jgi:hypothetical protein